MAVSAAAFTVSIGLCILNKNFPASLITQKTEKSMLTIFSSPVSIKLSSETSPIPEVLPESLADLNPTSISINFCNFWSKNGFDWIRKCDNSNQVEL